MEVTNDFFVSIFQLSSSYEAIIKSYVYGQHFEWGDFPQKVMFPCTIDILIYIYKLVCRLLFPIFKIYYKEIISYCNDHCIPKLNGMDKLFNKFDIMIIISY